MSNVGIEINKRIELAAKLIEQDESYRSVMADALAVGIHTLHNLEDSDFKQSKLQPSK